MTTFLALYSGKDVEHAELVAISANERLVEDFARRLVRDEPDRRPTAPNITSKKKPRPSSGADTQIPKEECTA